ncbi:hypothetical protein [Sorangium cellulosum]|uniref:hypothetical protein n=1 Tax=Sorangium cellulosum TaxID=56 RepID=UPI000410F1FF|nr:hypothetical protein [Sorangium cellulosum]
MRSRPAITLRVPRVVYAGDTFDVGISLDCAAETPIDFVRVTLEFTLAVQSNTDEDRNFSGSRALLVLGVDVAGKGRLGAGSHRYRVSFTLPGDVPPSHAGVIASLCCKVGALVSIPWWIDAAERKEILVRPSIAEAPRDEPLTSASGPESGAFLEVSLPGRTFAPGEILAGAVAFRGYAGSRPIALDVALVSVERHRTRDRSSERRRLSFFQELTKIAEGQEVPFRIALPRDLAPSFSFGEVSLEYVLEMAFKHMEGRLLHRVPVIVDMFEPRPGIEAKRPRIGADRWRALWSRAGQRIELSLAERELALRGVRAGCAVAVVPAERESWGGLAAMVRFAEPWGLHLDVRPRALLELGGVATGDSGFDRRFRVRGREEAQVLAALTPALRRALSAFGRAEVDDAEAWVWSAAAALDEPELAAFLAPVDALARALAEAGAALPPPAAMAAWLPAWRRFAEESDGALRVGPMRLSGTFEGAGFEVETLFKGAAPTGTRLVLRLDPPIAGAGRPRGAAEQRIAGVILEQAARLGGVAGAEEGVAVAAREIAVVLAGPLADPAAAREVLRPMLALAREMRGERRGGPYR